MSSAWLCAIKTHNLRLHMSEWAWALVCSVLQWLIICIGSRRAPTNSSTVVHLLPLPPGCKGEAIHLRWSQEPPVGPDGYESCWGLDNILVLNTANRPPLLEDNLDPLDTANWLFFPGATVKVHDQIVSSSTLETIPCEEAQNECLLWK